MKGKAYACMLVIFVMVSMLGDGVQAQDCVNFPWESQVILPHQKTVGVSVDLSGLAPDHLSRAAAEAAIWQAVATWNAALGGTLTLKKFTGSSPDRGVSHIRLSFGSNPTLFKGQGHDELAFTTKEVCRVRNYAFASIILNDTPAFYAQEGFSTSGAIDDTYDLELVVLHELGHALGLDHYVASDHVPPLMSTALATNRQLSQAGHTPQAVRHLFEQDRQLMAQALKKRDEIDLKGTYTGTVKVKEVEAKSAISVGREVPIHELTFGEKDDAWTIALRADKGERPFNVLPLLKEKILFSTLDPGRFLLSAEVTKVNEDEIKVRLEVKPTRYTMTLEGTLSKRKSSN